MDTAVHLARRQHRLILGILALRANRVTSSDLLIELLWRSSPPRQARAVIHSRISELRAALGELPAPTDRLLRTEGDGYLLDIRPDAVDAHRFQHLVRQAHGSRSDEQTRGLLRRALELWRGPVMGGWLPRDSLVVLGQALEQARLTCAEDLFEVELRLGHHRAVVDELLALSTANPARERLTGQAMRALHHAGRTAEATQVYDRYRRWLRDQLGLDPSGELQELYRAVLRGDRFSRERPPVTVPPGRTDPAEASSGTVPDGFAADVPRLLPADIADFTGRTAELEALCERLTRQRNAVAVVAVTGPAGVGKTALSVHLAHRLRDHFPDGQLFVNLRGVEADDPAAAFDVLGRFLRALGVDGLVVPSTLDERVDLYRGLLAHRRILVVLDNVGSADQVLPLIPGSPDCAVVINSRVRLGYAVGAYTVGLDVLDPEQATDLFSRIAGSTRVGSEPAAAGALAKLCGYLPLAIRVAAAKLATKPHWSLQRLADRLGDERRRLDHLTYGHLDVRSSIGLSYPGLKPDSQRLFRRLGILDLPEVNVWTSAALLDTTIATAEESLEELHDAQLVDIAGRDPSGHNRYRLHDLVRLVAKERIEAEESPDEVVAARRRVLGAWLFVADAAHRTVNGDDFLGIGGTTPRWPFDAGVLARLVAKPREWFEIERQSIIALVDLAARHRDAAPAWELACTTYELFDLARYFDDVYGVLQTAVAAARQVGDLRGEAVTLCDLAGVEVDRREIAEALRDFHTAQALFVQIGDRHGEARVLTRLAMMERFEGNDKTALLLYQQALPVLREFQDHGSLTLALRGIGQIHLKQGAHRDADACFIDALAACRRIGSPRYEAQVRYWQGQLRLEQGLVHEAMARFGQVLDMSRAFDDVPGRLYALRGLGLCYARQGDVERARATFTEALRLARQPRETRLERQFLDCLSDLDKSSGEPGS